MLTNKKFGIRVFALVLALLMTVAVFAGCSSDPVEDEQARADAEAAQKAAEEAKKSADSIAKDLADKLDELNKTLDKVNDSVDNVGDKVEQGDKNLQDQIDKWHNGETTADPDTMTKPDQDKVTGEVSEKVLAQFTELKNKFLVARETWYTTANYVALSKIFEEASFELYRTTTAEGVEALLADTETKANAVPSVVSDANAVQALIAKFGDVPATLFTTNEDMVKDARKAFDNWVEAYTTCFFAANGFTITSATTDRSIADFARKVTEGAIYINTNNDTNSLLYAEAKLAALYDFAKKAIRDELAAQLVIEGVVDTLAEAEAIVNVLYDEDATNIDINEALANFTTVKGLVTYSQCKANAKAIEDQYVVYRQFWNANGGDDTPIKDNYKLLTGEQFVKLYVLCLYDGELIEYEKMVKDEMLNKFVPYFMNAGNDSYLKSTYSWNFLSLNASYDKGYDSADYWSALETTDASNLTLAVEQDSIDVYKNGTKIDSIKITNGEWIERELEKVVTAFDKKVLSRDYSSDFKGKKSLDEAYVEIDQYVAQAVVEMVNVWYKHVFTPFIETYSNEVYDNLAAAYKSTGTDVYAKHNNAFYTQASNLLKAANDKLENITFKSYEDLKISDQRIFNVVKVDSAIDSIAFNTNDGDETSSNNSAFVSIVKSAYEAIDAAILAYDNVYVDLVSASEVHAYATAVAKELDELVGIDNGKTGDKWDWNTTTSYSELIKDYGTDYKKVVGDSNYKEEEVYKKLVAARDEAVADILSVKLLNDDGTLAIDKETYAALNSDGKPWYNANSTTLSLITTAKDNHAVTVVVDPEIVAAHIIIDKFAKGADAVVLAFCDATRETVKAALNTGLDFYAEKYSFGDLDHVKLEPDMKSFIAYLEGLTEFAGLGSKFSTASFSLKNQAITGTTGTANVFKTANKVTTWYMHVDSMDKDIDDITGVRSSTDTASWYVMTKANLDNYFNIKNGTIIEDGLNAVRELSYKKDNLKNSELVAAIELSTPGKFYSSIGSLYAKYTGTVKDGKFTVAPKTGYEYDLNNERTALYLYRLAEVKDAVIAKVAAVNLITGIESGDDVAGAKAAALAELEKIMNQYNNPVSDGEKASESLDDYSLPIAYDRYYTTKYDWTDYRK